MLRAFVLIGEEHRKIIKGKDLKRKVFCGT
jgi:hypothetical protein